MTTLFWCLLSVGVSQVISILIAKGMIKKKDAEWDARFSAHEQDCENKMSVLKK